MGIDFSHLTSRQILTTKVDPRTARVKILKMVTDKKKYLALQGLIVSIMFQTKKMPLNVTDLVVTDAQLIE